MRVLQATRGLTRELPANWNNYKDGRFQYGETGARSNRHDLLAALLASHPHVRGNEFETIAAEKGLGRDRARTFLMNGIQSKRIRVEKGSHNTRYYSWIGDPGERTQARL